MRPGKKNLFYVSPPECLVVPVVVVHVDDEVVFSVDPPLRTSSMVDSKGYCLLEVLHNALKSSRSRAQTITPPNPLSLTHLVCWSIDKQKISI